MANDIQTEARRLAILQLLHADPDYSINDSLMQPLLAAQGHGVSIAVVRADFAWLEQVGLLSTNELAGMTLAVLRNEGVDVATGVAVMPGVARPRPA
ncbi:ArsR family transcriptional regulator [Methylomonas sp. SURF-1]|uniref:ArsR family transcriptional regulator n=1 Tax=Methylomonas aurea TaxID=2952224 RepID=A0ABT1UJ13_9GAMM|nr:ArsR family transcriptional regulator [Methylomonas sp. SURF-1]MCQ8182185.1 ArsR family transcriptional regulator [Methylomonas sp. SURF-1]